MKYFILSLFLCMNAYSSGTSEFYKAMKNFEALSRDETEKNDELDNHPPPKRKTGIIKKRTFRQSIGNRKSTNQIEPLQVLGYHNFYRNPRPEYSVLNKDMSSTISITSPTEKKSSYVGINKTNNENEKLDKGTKVLKARKASQSSILNIKNKVLVNSKRYGPTRNNRMIHLKTAQFSTLNADLSKKSIPYFGGNTQSFIDKKNIQTLSTLDGGRNNDLVVEDVNGEVDGKLVGMARGYKEIQNDLEQAEDKVKKGNDASSMYQEIELSRRRLKEDYKEFLREEMSLSDQQSEDVSKQIIESTQKSFYENDELLAAFKRDNSNLDFGNLNLNLQAEEEDGIDNRNESEQGRDIFLGKDPVDDYHVGLLEPRSIPRLETIEHGDESIVVPNEALKELKTALSGGKIRELFLQDNARLMIPLNSDQHWTSLEIEKTGDTYKLSFFDPQGSKDSENQVKKNVGETLRIFSSEIQSVFDVDQGNITLEANDRVIQRDGNSCGVIMKAHITHRLQGKKLPQDFDMAQAFIDRTRDMVNGNMRIKRMEESAGNDQSQADVKIPNDPYAELAGRIRSILIPNKGALDSDLGNYMYHKTLSEFQDKLSEEKAKAKIEARSHPDLDKIKESQDALTELENELTEKIDQWGEKKDEVFRKLKESETEIDYDGEIDIKFSEDKTKRTYTSNINSDHPVPKNDESRFGVPDQAKKKPLRVLNSHNMFRTTDKRPTVLSPSEKNHTNHEQFFKRRNNRKIKRVESKKNLRKFVKVVKRNNTKKPDDTRIKNNSVKATRRPASIENPKNIKKNQSVVELPPHNFDDQNFKPKKEIIKKNPPSSLSIEGDKFFINQEPYTKGNQLGRGKFGEVYELEGRRRKSKNYVLKLSKGSTDQDRKKANSFLEKEAKDLKRLSDAGAPVPKFMAFKKGKGKNPHLLIMEKADGTLKDLIDKFTQYPSEKNLKTLAKLVVETEVIHVTLHEKHGFFHRDYHAENVFYKKNGNDYELMVGDLTDNPKIKVQPPIYEKVIEKIKMKDSYASKKFEENLKKERKNALRTHEELAELNSYFKTGKLKKSNKTKISKFSSRRPEAPFKEQQSVLPSLDRQNLKLGTDNLKNTDYIERKKELKKRRKLPRNFFHSQVTYNASVSDVQGPEKDGDEVLNNFQNLNENIYRRNEKGENIGSVRMLLLLKDYEEELMEEFTY